MAISGSVGAGGANKLADVLVVQHLLNEWLKASGQALLHTDGDCGPRTIRAITDYQARILNFPKPDALIEPGGKSWIALAAGQGSRDLLSGAAWWHANQARFPNSARLIDLAPPFRARATKFVDALQIAGAQVLLSSTLRNPIRAHLMHYSWRLSRGEISPAAIPVLAGLSIRWDHGDVTRSRDAARAMSGLFNLAFQPALTSLHIQGRAIDMTINWQGTLRITDNAGKRWSIAAPRSGNNNADLHKVGASFGVFKLLSDPPHWSETGR